MINMGIKSIEFGFMSPKMIKDISAVKIDFPELYDPDGYPIDRGLTDLHLGVVDPGLRCRTCGGSIGQCTGHFGYIELTKPVIHPMYGKKIYMLLCVTCRKCSRILVNTDNLKKGNTLSELYKKRPAVCQHCKETQKPITYNKPTVYFQGATELSPEDVRQRLEKISDEDFQLLKVKGGRPEWFVLTLLPVPPVTVRPSITLETGERSEDDITHKLVDVVRINERLRKNLEIGAPDFIIKDIWELLQYHVSTFMSNEIPTLPPARHRSGRSLKTIMQRLGKKDGRFRGNLSGKRVNFSARTVISPDACISIGEVGIPFEIAKELTVPIRVDKHNMVKLKEMVLNGPVSQNGANYVIRPDNLRKKITEENKAVIVEEIDIGYIIERHLIDGDIVIMNRQPSLHRVSMLAHKAKIMPYRTFRLPLGVTIPYNADFDGDEMNLHVPQTEEAQIEAEILMGVKNHIRSPRYGLPIIACKHDHITGCYLLTKDDTKIDKIEAAQILNTIGIEIEELKESYKGKEIFSFLLPKDLTVSYKSAVDGQDVIIKNGNLVSGVIDDESLGEKKGKLIDLIDRKYGPDVVQKFIDQVSRLALEVISRKGFSISTSDMDITPKAVKKIDSIIAKYNDDVELILKEADKDVNVENKILQLGSNASNEASGIIKNDLPLNSAVIMAKTGARGSFVNLAQMCAFIGQETLEGERIQRGYTNRTLSVFKCGDMGLKSRGYVSGCYKRGLDPVGMFFDAMNSRENLMDKSLHTRHSGYMERRLVNALQDLKIEYNGTVSDSKGRIVQFVAGEDGLDPAKIDCGKIQIERVFT